MFDAAMGSFADVGVEIAINKEGRVMAPLDVKPNSPAQKAGLWPNDLRVGPPVGEPAFDMGIWPSPVILV
jgi:C-terminal processing protease CtpA/Prc